MISLATQVFYEPDEGRRVQRPKLWDNNNKDEDNSVKITLNSRNLHSNYRGINIVCEIII